MKERHEVYVIRGKGSDKFESTTVFGNRYVRVKSLTGYLFE